MRIVVIAYVVIISFLFVYVALIGSVAHYDIASNLKKLDKCKKELIMRP